MFKQLINHAVVSGMEENIRTFIHGQLKPYCQFTEIDGMGNLHAINRGEGPDILLVTYLDEPGIIVTKITEDGYLCFETVGRINPAFLVSKRVSLGDISGVISLKAIHLTTPKEREIPIKTSQLLIDIGATSKEEAEKVIEVGDYGTLDIPFVALKNNYVKGRALAGRMGCWVAMEILKKNPNRNIHVIFAVQREIGNRGLIGCSDRIRADYVVALDGIKAKDYVNSKNVAPESGSGVVIISRYPGGILRDSMDKTCRVVAQKEEISLQYGVKESADIEDLFVKEGYSDVLSLAIPVRYADSVAPVANLNDMDSALHLVNGFIYYIAKEEER